MNKWLVGLGLAVGVGPGRIQLCCGVSEAQMAEPQHSPVQMEVACDQ